MPEFSTMLDLQAQMMLLLAIGVFWQRKAHHRPGPRLSDRPAALHHPACEHHPVVPHRVQRGNFPQHPGHPHPVDFIAGALRRRLRGVLQPLPLARKAVMQYGTVEELAKELEEKPNQVLFAPKPYRY